MENYTNPEVAEAPKSNKKLPLILIAVVAAVAVIVAAIFVVPSLFGKIDVCEYVKVKETTGFDGSGYVSVEFDYVKLAKELEFEEIKDIKELAEIQEENNIDLEDVMEHIDDIGDEYDLDLDELEDLFEAVSIKIKNNGTFSNGDTAVIKITVDEDEDFGSSLSGGEIEHKIKDLKAIVTLNLDFKCEFSGLDGNGTADASIVVDEYEDWHNNVYFNIPSNGSLSNGDKVSVEAYIDNYEVVHTQLLEEGYELPSSFTKEFTVSGLGQKLTQSNCTAEIINQAEAIVKENVKLADETLVPVVSMVYLVEDSNQNYIVVALEFPDSANNRIWNHIRYLTNVSVTADGKLDYGTVEHVLGGNGFKHEQQEQYILNFSDFYGCDFIKLR